METFYCNTGFRKGVPVRIIDPNEVKHAFSSLRLRCGNEILLINGTGGRVKCRIDDISKKEMIATPVETVNCDTEYTDTELTIAVSILNRTSKMKLVTEKLTEIGISGLIPFISERTSFPKMSAVSLRPHMISALKQCGGSRDVKISDPVRIEDLALTEGYDLKLFAQIGGESIPENYKKGKVLVLIGPEGGFSKNEIEMLNVKGFKSVSLNKRVLRAETAAIVAASRFLK